MPNKIRMRDKWAAMIDVNNVCLHGCTYCTKHIRHLRPDQIGHMTMTEIEKAIDSLGGWERKIGFTGGEPLNHPELSALMQLIRWEIPKHRAMLFTSNGFMLDKYREEIDQTFGEVYINLHNDDQKKVCKHQPLLLAVEDMVPDVSVRNSLIENCWCNKMWSPIIGKKGAFFCDCALGLDMVLDGPGGYPVEPGWIDRDYADQMERYCGFCGMCLPYPQATLDTKEKISSGLYEKFKALGLRHLDDMEVIDTQLTISDIGNNLDGWEPWHNRQDKGFEGPAYTNC